MTGPHRHPVELLAQLEADALGPIAAARARRQLAADPRTATARAAMSATRAELAELAAAPVPQLPAAVAARCAGALAALPPPRNAGPVAAAAGWRRRAAAAVVAAAVLGGGMAVGLGLRHGSDPTGASGLPTVPGEPVRLSLTQDTLAFAVADGLTQRDLGPLNDPPRLAACQRAAGLPAQPPLGGRQVLLDGQPGVLLVLTTGVVGRFRLVVVVPGCGTSPVGPVLADLVVGR